MFEKQIVEGALIVLRCKCAMICGDLVQIRVKTTSSYFNLTLEYMNTF